MLLVMETTGLFNKENTDLKFSQLCGITKDRIESFLPGLWEDLFKASSNNCNKSKSEVPAVVETATVEMTETVVEAIEQIKNEETSLVKAVSTDNFPAASSCEKVQEVQNL